VQDNFSYNYSHQLV